MPANPLAWLAIQPALGSPPQARKSARIDPVFGTQCSQTSRTSGRAGDYESSDSPPHARITRPHRPRIAPASRLGGRGCARATRAFCYYNYPRHYFFRSIAPMFACLRAVLLPCCGLPRPHACVFYGVFDGVIRSTPLLFGCFFAPLNIRPLSPYFQGMG